MHPAEERIAAVLGRSQGSGYLLTPRLVLTAAHVVGDASAPQVVVPGGVGPVRCKVVWARDEKRRCDAALLLAERDLVTEEVAGGFEPLLWGRARDLRALPGAQAVGFPQVQRDVDGELDTEQVVGALKPGSNLLSGRHVLDSDHGAPEALADGGSPWAGMSGAAVFVDGLLAGVVCADPKGWNHGRLMVTSSATLWSHFDFLSECLRAGHKPETRPLTSTRQLEVEAFERRLRDYIIGKVGELTIVGLTLSDGEGETWPLDAAYLSLELTGVPRSTSAEGFGVPGGGGRGDTAVRSSPRRAEDALAGQKRVLLRGAAGSGKTTLLQWLATISARGDLPPGLSHLSDCVPLTLPLRSLIRKGELPQPEEFLAAAARPLAGLPAAAGWVTRRLTEGSVLLLIDGVDEVPEADRRRTLAWVKDLLAAYPEARYVITTRPSAVREGWLSDAGFTELELLPMSRGDVAAFIDRWHTAAGAGQNAQLRVFRDALTTAVVAKPDLGRLATNPLMCALICALNRSRRGYLPHGRMELYRAALELLLVRRDREREIVAGRDGMELEHTHQVALLQKIAYWLIRNGRSEIEWHKAVEILERALPAMPSVAARGSAEEVLHHLVLRSGLLRRPTSETLDFIHRTFQDYLGAQAAVDDWDFDVLVNHAHDDQWEDVLRMAVGHAPPRARAELLDMLLKRGDGEETHRYRLHLLAAACLEHATELEYDVRARVEKAAAELVPPRDQESAKVLATAGRVVLDLLPGPEGLYNEVAHAVVVAATLVADDRAIPLLSRYATHPSLEVRSQLAWAWDRFDTEQYADAVIGKLSYKAEGTASLAFVAKTREHLIALRRLGGRPEVQWRGTLAPDDLPYLATPALTDLSLRECQNVIDLRQLRDCPPLRSLRITESEGVSHLGALNGEALRTLQLSLFGFPRDLEAVAGLERLESLDFECTDPGAPDGPDGELPLPPRLKHLALGRGAAGLRLVGMSRHPRLTTVFLNNPERPLSDFSLAALPRLGTLGIRGMDLTTLRHGEPLPGVSDLVLAGVIGLTGLAHLPEIFPGTRTLTLTSHAFAAKETLDLGLLEGLSLESLYLSHPGPVRNEDVLPSGCALYRTSPELSL